MINLLFLRTNIMLNLQVEMVFIHILMAYLNLQIPKQKNGWYEYSNFFVNVLIALDECNKKNGTIELAKQHKGNFNDLLKKTKNDGTPAIKSSVLKNIKFNAINLKIGDAVFFSNTCPHKSKKIYQKKIGGFYIIPIQNLKMILYTKCTTMTKRIVKINSRL